MLRFVAHFVICSFSLYSITFCNFFVILLFLSIVRYYCVPHVQTAQQAAARVITNCTASMLTDSLLTEANLQPFTIRAD